MPSPRCGDRRRSRGCPNRRASRREWLPTAGRTAWPTRSPAPVPSCISRAFSSRAGRRTTGRATSRSPARWSRRRGRRRWATWSSSARWAPTRGRGTATSDRRARRSASSPARGSTPPSSGRRCCWGPGPRAGGPSSPPRPGPAARVLGGGAHRLRPLDVDDLCRAVLGCCEQPAAGVRTCDLVGPETLTHRELIERTADRLGREVSFRSTPVWLARLAAGLAGLLRKGGMAPAVIDVITSDETVDRERRRRAGRQPHPVVRYPGQAMSDRPAVSGRARVGVRRPGSRAQPSAILTESWQTHPR